VAPLAENSLRTEANIYSKQGWEPLGATPALDKMPANAHYGTVGTADDLRKSRPGRMVRQRGIFPDSNHDQVCGFELGHTKNLFTGIPYFHTYVRLAP
jgi:hypothetical protein